MHDISTTARPLEDHRIHDDVVPRITELVHGLLDAYSICACMTVVYLLAHPKMQVPCTVLVCVQRSRARTRSTKAGICACSPHGFRESPSRVTVSLGR